MPGLSSAEKKARLARISYTDFVDHALKLDPGVLLALPDAHARSLRRRRRRRAGAGRVCARPAGLRAVWTSTTGPAPGRTTTRCTAEAARTTTSISPTATRRSRACWCAGWCPAAIPGSTTEDMVTSRADYAQAGRGGIAGAHPPRAARCCACATPGPQGGDQRVEVDLRAVSTSRNGRTSRP